MPTILNGHALRLDVSATGSIGCSVSYVDLVDAATTATPTTKLTRITTAANDTDIGDGAPAASTKRAYTFISIVNESSSVSNTITLEHYNGAIAIPLSVVWLRLLPYEAFYMINGMPMVLDAYGRVKDAGSPGNLLTSTQEFMLTGVSATPVMVADSTSLSTIYAAPFTGNAIVLWDGTNWQRYTSAEFSLAVTGRTTDLPFDIFCYANAGVPTLEFLDWTSATARATGLTRTDGVWGKTGDQTRRWLGSCRARSATTFHWVQTGTDLPVKFDLFNADNRVARCFKQIATTDTWVYTTATPRQAQGSANYQVDIMVGLEEETMDAQLQVTSRNSTISIARNVGIGYDSTTVMSGIFAANANTVTAIECSQTASLCNRPTIGRHYYAWLEISTATGTCTWYGDNGALRVQSGMTGVWIC
jgi:hypothetical protein